nr:histone h3 methyltransferase [Hymenolepis microstoma]
MSNYIEITLKSPAGAADEVFRLYRLSDTTVAGREISEVINSIMLDVEGLHSNKALLTRFSSVNWESLESVTSYCELYNSCVSKFVDHWKNNSTVPEFCRRKASGPQLKFIMNLCYNRSIEEPDKLNKYTPFSPQVYGETSFELIQQILEHVKTTADDTFIDLGSGVGQVVLQVAASSDVKFSRGIEKAAYPAECARRMDKEFRRWMGFFGKPYQPYELIEGDFLSDEYRAVIETSTVVFANNFAFGPVLDYHLTQIFSGLQEGARIISSKAFCSRSKRLSDRQLNDLSSMVRVTNLEPVNDGVSWTDKPFTYFVHVIDRSLLLEYFKETHAVEKRRSTRGRRSVCGSSSSNSSCVGTPNTLSASNSDGSTAGSTAPSVCGSEMNSGPGSSNDSNARKRRRRNITFMQKKKRRTICPKEIVKLAVKQGEDRGSAGHQQQHSATSASIETSSHLEQGASPLSSLEMNSEDVSNTDSTSFTPRSQLLADDDCSTPSPPQTTSSIDSAFSPDIDFKHIKSEIGRGEKSVISSTRVQPSSYFVSRWQETPNQNSTSIPKRHHHHHHHKHRSSTNFTSNPMKHHFRRTQHVPNSQLERMRCPQYLNILRESIKREEIRRSELMGQMTKLEASLNEIRAQGREQFKDIMERFGVLESGPTAFFTEARQLIRFHRNLELKLTELQNSINNLTDINAELLKRQFMLEAQLVDDENLATGPCPPPPQLFPEPEIAPTPPPTLAPTTDEDLASIPEHSIPSLVPPTLTPIPGNLIDDLEISNSKLASGTVTSSTSIGKFETNLENKTKI